MKQSENIPDQGKLRSKTVAVSLFNELKRLRLREETEIIHHNLSKMVYKTALFKHFYLARASQEELLQLAAFLDQGDFAEDVLQEVYK